MLPLHAALPTSHRRPAGMLMTLDAGAAPAIDARKILFERRRFAISPAHHAVESAEAAFSAGAIVGGYDHQRVVEFARPAQRFQNASELKIGRASCRERVCQDV